jgi:hypothetical protein
MINPLFFGVAFLFVVCLGNAWGEDPAGPPAQAVPSRDKAFLLKFIQVVKSGDKKALAGSLKYPIFRKQPLPPILNSNEFIAHYDEFVDPAVIKEMEQDSKNLDVDPKQGTTVVGGEEASLIINQGAIDKYYYRTELQNTLAAAAKDQMNSAARDFQEVLYACNTAKHQIKILEIKNKVHYFSWKFGQPLSEKPEIDLIGTDTEEGTGGNMSYVFKNPGGHPKSSSHGHLKFPHLAA